MQKISETFMGYFNQPIENLHARVSSYFIGGQIMVPASPSFVGLIIAINTPSN